RRAAAAASDLRPKGVDHSLRVGYGYGYGTLLSALLSACHPFAIRLPSVCHPLRLPPDRAESLAVEPYPPKRLCHLRHPLAIRSPSACHRFAISCVRPCVRRRLASPTATTPGTRTSRGSPIRRQPRPIGRRRPVRRRGWPCPPQQPSARTTPARHPHAAD